MARPWYDLHLDSISYYLTYSQSKASLQWSSLKTEEGISREEVAFSLWGFTQFGTKVEYFYLERKQDTPIDDFFFAVWSAI